MSETAVVPVTDIRELLQVQPPDAFVDWVNALFYADPGGGKTWLCGTADDSEETSPVLILDVEGGLTTIRHRERVDAVPIRSENDIVEVYNKLYHSIKDGKMYYKTTCIDSLTELASLIMKVTMDIAYNANPDKVVKEVPSPREWGIVREKMRKIVRGFRDLPCHVIYTAHVSYQQDEGQPIKMFPGFAGKLRQDIPGFMDIVGYMYSENDGGEVTRKVQFAQTRRVVAKDRTSALGDFMDNPTIPMIWDLISNSNTHFTYTDHGSEQE